MSLVGQTRFRPDLIAPEWPDFALMGSPGSEPHRSIKVVSHPLTASADEASGRSGFGKHGKGECSELPRKSWDLRGQASVEIVPDHVVVEHVVDQPQVLRLEIARQEVPARAALGEALPVALLVEDPQQLKGRPGGGGDGFAGDVVDPVGRFKFGDDLMDDVPSVRLGDDIVESCAGIRRFHEIERPEQRRGASVSRRDPKVKIDGRRGQARIERLFDQSASEDQHDVRPDRGQEINAVVTVQSVMADQMRRTIGGRLVAEEPLLGICPVREMADEIVAIHWSQPGIWLGDEVLAVFDDRPAQRKQLVDRVDVEEMSGVVAADPQEPHPPAPFLRESGSISPWLESISAVS